MFDGSSWQEDEAAVPGRQRQYAVSVGMPLPLELAQEMEVEIAAAFDEFVAADLGSALCSMPAVALGQVAGVNELQLRWVGVPAEDAVEAGEKAGQILQLLFELIGYSLPPVARFVAWPEDLATVA